MIADIFKQIYKSQHSWPTEHNAAVRSPFPDRSAGLSRWKMTSRIKVRRLGRESRKPETRNEAEARNLRKGWWTSDSP